MKGQLDSPKEHDVSGVFRWIVWQWRSPGLVSEGCGTYGNSIAELAKQRGLAGYGFEEGITAEYFRDYAPEALRVAKDLYQV